jgi:hypothetical protein
MGMVAVKPPYTLILRDDDIVDSPRETDDCFGAMVCWHRRYNLGDKHDHGSPEDFLRELLTSHYSANAAPVYDYLKAGKSENARMEYNRSTHEWELQENNWWSSGSDWYMSSSYPASQKGKDVPDWFLDECLAALGMKELMELVEDMDDVVILPLYLYDHSGITMSTSSFGDPWDSGQVGWIYADKDKILSEFGGNALTPELREKAEKLLRGEVDYYDHYIRGDCYGFQLYRENEEIDSCWGFIGDTDDLRDAIESYMPEDCKGIMNNLTYRYDNPDIEDILREHEDEFDMEVI